MTKPSSFSHFLKGQDWSAHSSSLQQIGPQQIEFALKRQGQGGIDDLRALLSPLAGEKYLEDMAKLSHTLTRKRFGQAIRLFAPMYLSNECNNVCDYCGFSMHNKIARKTLTDLEILREAGILKKRGFDHVLLVTGESNQQVGMNYLSHAIDSTSSALC